MTLKKTKKIDNNVIAWFLSNCRVYNYPLNSTLIYQGEKSQTLFYIISGIVTILTKDEEGKEVLLYYSKSGEFFNILNLFNKNTEHTSWSRAKTICKIATISYKEFLKLSYNNPEILVLLTSQLSKKLQIFLHQSGNLSFLNIQGQIAQVLIDASKNPKMIIRYLKNGTIIKITIQEIAQIVSCSEDIVERVLLNFKNKCLISLKEKHITIYDIF